MWHYMHSVNGYMNHCMHWSLPAELFFLRDSGRYFSHGICWPYHVLHATKPQLNQAGKQINPQSFLSKANWMKEWYDSGGEPWVSAEKEIVLVFEGGGIHGQGRQRVYTGKAAEHGHWRPSQGRQSVHIGRAVEHKHWSLGDTCSGHAGEEEAV